MTKVKAKTKTKAPSAGALKSLQEQVSILRDASLPSRVTAMEKVTKTDFLKTMEDRFRELTTRVHSFISRETIVTETVYYLKSKHSGEDISRLLTVVVASLDAPEAWWDKHMSKHYNIGTWARVFTEIETKGLPASMWYVP